MPQKNDEVVLGETTVSSHWQIAVLIAVRPHLKGEKGKLETGDVLVFKLVDGRVVLEMKGGEKL